MYCVTYAKWTLSALGGYSTIKILSSEELFSRALLPTFTMLRTDCSRHGILLYLSEICQVTDVGNTRCRFSSFSEWPQTQESWDHLSVIVVRKFWVGQISCKAFSTLSWLYSSGTNFSFLIFCSLYHPRRHKS